MHHERVGYLALLAVAALIGMSHHKSELSQGQATPTRSGDAFDRERREGIIAGGSPSGNYSRTPRMNDKKQGYAGVYSGVFIEI